MNNSTRNLLTFSIFSFLFHLLKAKKEENKMSNDFLNKNNAERKDKFSIIENETGCTSQQFI